MVIIIKLLEKVRKKKHAKNIRIDVWFWKVTDTDNNWILLNGKDRHETNKKIVSYIGSYEDFIMTSLKLQKDVSFVDYPQCKKKDFLIKLLKLDVFEELSKLAKEKLKEIMVLYNDIIVDIKNSNINIKKEELLSEKEKIKFLKEKINEVKNEINKNYKNINQLSLNITDLNNDKYDLEFNETKNNLEQTENKNKIINNKIDQNLLYIENLEKKQKEIKSLINEYSNKENIKNYNSIILKNKDKICKLEKEIKFFYSEIKEEITINYSLEELKKIKSDKKEFINILNQKKKNYLKKLIIQ